MNVLLSQKQFSNLNNLNNIEVKQIENMQSKRIMVLIDNLHSFVMEIKEAKGDTLKSVIKNSVYRTKLHNVNDTFGTF